MKTRPTKSLKLAFYKACAGAAFVSSVFGGVAEARSVDFDAYDERVGKIAQALVDPDVSPRELVRMGYSRNNARDVNECRQEWADKNPTATDIHRCTNIKKEHRFLMAVVGSVVLTPLSIWVFLAYMERRTQLENKLKALKEKNNPKDTRTAAQKKADEVVTRAQNRKKPKAGPQV